MRKLITTWIVILATTATAFSQLLDPYKFVIVPTLKYNNGAIDVWNISGMLQSMFTTKGFIVLSEDNFAENKQLREDPCLALICQINHTNVTSGVNKVTISLKNCEEKVIYTKTGSAMGWSMQDDYNKATKRAFDDINSMSYSFNPDRLISKEREKALPSLELTGYTEDSLKSYFSANRLDPIEGIYKSYQGNNMPFYKIGIIKSNDKYKAVILESEFSYWKTGELKAVFEPTSVKDVFSARWYMGDKKPFETFATIEHAALLNIQLRDNAGKATQDRFIKMYPSAKEVVSSSKENSKASGSGFFVSENGIIATNAHVIADAERIEVSVSNERGLSTYNAKVILMDGKNDVALLQIDDQKFQELSSIPYSIVENSAVGSKVFTIGYPLNDVMGSNYKVTDGIISSLSGISDDVRYYQISVPIQPGNSGGPLFNKDGNIIGITSARLNSKAVGVQVENVNYAIKSSYLLSLINMLPNPRKSNPTPQIVSKELEDQVKVLRNYVCLIKIF